MKAARPVGGGPTNEHGSGPLDPVCESVDLIARVLVGFAQRHNRYRDHADKSQDRGEDEVLSHERPAPHRYVPAAPFPRSHSCSPAIGGPA